MKLIKILTVTGKLGLIGMISGCASEPIKSSVIAPVLEEISEETPQKGKPDQDYSVGTFVVFGDCTGLIRTKEGLIGYNSEGKQEETEDLIGNIPSYAIQEGLNSGGTVYENGFPKNHPCYASKSKKKR